MRVILLGPPGVGKGTQAAILSKNKSLVHISTGEIMRTAVANQTELGLKVRSYLDSGQLVPDQIMMDLIKERLQEDDCNTGFVLDGLPRTLAQAESLDYILLEIKKPITHVIEIVADQQVLVDRILKRGRDSGRSDDTEQVIRTRLDVYKKQTAPVSDYYRQKEKLLQVNGTDSIDRVSSAIDCLIN